MISGRKQEEKVQGGWSLHEHTPLCNLVEVSVLPLQPDTLHSRRTGAVFDFFKHRTVHPRILLIAPHFTLQTVTDSKKNDMVILSRPIIVKSIIHCYMKPDILWANHVPLKPNTYSRSRIQHIL